MTREARLDLRLHFLHPADDALDVAGDVELASLPGAGGNQNVGVAELFEVLDRRSRSAALDLNAVAFHERYVLVDGFIGNTERGDDIARHAAELFFAFKDRGLDAGSAEKVCSGNTCRAAADDGSLLAGDLFWNLDVGHQGAVAVLCGDQLGVANLDRLVIEVARALVLTAVRADGAGDERQRVLFGDELERGTVKTLAAELHVFGDILMNRAAALAGRGEAVDPGYFFLGLSRSDRLDGFEMVEVCVAGSGHVADGACVGAAEGAVGKRLNLFDHLVQAVISAGLEDCSRDRDGPDTGGEQLVAVEEFRAACKGDAHFAVKLPGDAIAHFDRQREQASAGHVHFGAGQLVSRRVDREGVGELQTKFQTLRICQRLQALEHRNGVDPLQVLVEVMLVEDDVIVAHGI